ncbi:hypothetical protein FA95DRAFT_1408074 [Auriscalpium vulgare]|uniref:Uncharacterized protein n=1 Tax=Auriscalpium vulgare TaxID=40419 RepID=A0ACB8RPW0_9AGAM|nr:hypothetical protein FA95DRAFT_1408074 [Auriscalpium vulgare]
MRCFDFDFDFDFDLRGSAGAPYGDGCDETRARTGTRQESTRRCSETCAGGIAIAPPERAFAAALRASLARLCRATDHGSRVRLTGPDATLSHMGLSVSVGLLCQCDVVDRPRMSSRRRPLTRHRPALPSASASLQWLLHTCRGRAALDLPAPPSRERTPGRRPRLHVRPTAPGAALRRVCSAVFVPRTTRPLDRCLLTARCAGRHWHAASPRDSQALSRRISPRAPHSCTCLGRRLPPPPASQVKSTRSPRPRPRPRPCKRKRKRKMDSDLAPARTLNPEPQARDASRAQARLMHDGQLLLESSIPEPIASRAIRFPAHFIAQTPRLNSAARARRGDRQLASAPVRYACAGAVCMAPSHRVAVAVAVGSVSCPVGFWLLT